MVLIRSVGGLILLYCVALVVSFFSFMLSPKGPGQSWTRQSDAFRGMAYFFLFWLPLLKFLERTSFFQATEKKQQFLFPLVYGGYLLGLIALGCLCLFL